MSTTRALAWLSFLVACAGPGPTPRKELYVEPAAGEPGAPASPLEAYPLLPEAEATGWIALRTLHRDRQDGVERLARTLDVWAPGAPQGPVRPDLSQQAREPRPPALLFFLPAREARRDTACYLGHSAFAVRGQRRPSVLHHLRLLVVNREGEPLVVPPGALRCEGVISAAGAEGELRELERPAVADELGREVEELIVPPGGERTWHLFFTSSRLDPALRLSWRVELAARPGEPPSAGPWDFVVGFQRRYVLDPAQFTELEERVARGEPLARAPRQGDPWREPMLEPVPAPPE